jgi:hypothetical protein
LHEWQPRFLFWWLREYGAVIVVGDDVKVMSAGAVEVEGKVEAVVVNAEALDAEDLLLL